MIPHRAILNRLQSLSVGFALCALSLVSAGEALAAATSGLNRWCVQSIPSASR